MKRILVVARTEFLALVKTKAFIIGILMVPVLIGISIAFQIFAARQGDRDDHRFAVVDDTGVLFAVLEKAALEHNAESGSGDTRKGPHYLPERAPTDAADRGALRSQLSDRVRSRDLFAFVEFPASLLTTDTTERDQLRYYTQTPSYSGLPNWIRSTIERAVTERRLATAALDPQVVARLTRDTTISTLGLVTRDASGQIVEGGRISEVQTFIVPFAMMYLLFIAVMSAAPPLLTAVVEEKMSRISEVLIASIPPFHLMAGKLLGVAAVSMVLALLYVGGGLYALMSAGQLGLVASSLFVWFVVFLVLAVLQYGAIFVAIGAACSDIKDSQSMMQPVMLVLMLPILAVPVILRSPESTFATVITLFPTATPFLMLARLAMSPPPPVWHVALGLVLTTAMTVACIAIGAKIFRVGLLMQGKAPNLPELLRWIRR
jgi:ABC-2 type transport system permease protein